MAKKPSPTRPLQPAASLAASRPSKFPAETEDIRQIGQALMAILAVAVGIVTGFGAVLFRDLIGLIHNVLFLGQFVGALRRQPVHAAEPLGRRWSSWCRCSARIAVTFLVTNFAPEARGHGVPEVMDAIYYKGGVIRPVVAVVKSLASAIAIGSGAAVGREGPIIQIGSALGSTLGQIVRMPAGQRIILVAAGAGAGIAATFNTPIGGVMFAIELMMPEVSVRTFLPVALATGTATFIGRFFFGPQPAFAVPQLAPMSVDATLGDHALPLRAARGRHRRRRGGLRPRPASRRRPLRQDQGTLHAACAGHAAGRHLDLRPAAALRPLLRRGRRLRDGAGDPARPIVRRRTAAAAFRLQAAGDLAQPRFGFLGRHLLAVAVHGRDDRRRLRRRFSLRCICRSPSTSRPSPWSAWGRWSAAAPAR